MKCVSTHQDLQIFVLKSNSLEELVGCGSETQLQVGENLNKLTDDKG